MKWCRDYGWVVVLVLATMLAPFVLWILDAIIHFGYQGDR